MSSKPDEKDAVVSAAGAFILLERGFDAYVLRGGLASAEPDLLTRPMRLSDHQSGSRRPRVDGSYAGA